ncbi:MAG: hypothetical protein ACE5KA_06355 [Nitrososphaerales archaeon]
MGREKKGAAGQCLELASSVTGGGNTNVEVQLPLKGPHPDPNSPLYDEDSWDNPVCLDITTNGDLACTWPLLSDLILEGHEYYIVQVRDDDENTYYITYKLEE